MAQGRRPVPAGVCLQQRPGGRATEALRLSAESRWLPRPSFRVLGPGDRSRQAWRFSLPWSQTAGRTGPGLTLTRSETRAPCDM